MKNKKLTKLEEQVIVLKGTEPAFSGKYLNNKDEGTYTCKRCDTPLYYSKDKFDSNCGWPSFDDEIEGAVKRVPDADGVRIEIQCSNCGGHLGHVFRDEGFTKKNIRHCVNSISLNFIPKKKKVIKYPVGATEKAVFASGCFWGTEYHFQRKKGVVSTTSGYTGGHKKNATYKEVCEGTSGHAEAVEVIFDPEKISYEELVKLFFETHDQSQVNRQGPDIGEQYRSEIFYLNDKQKKTAEKMIGILKTKGYKVATKVTKASKFREAEKYHQDYYRKNRGTPYCHFFLKKF
ncbi:MAG: bifunctional methionine sulfoxide reductase B/A protein [Acidobacteriota bacterium]